MRRTRAHTAGAVRRGAAAIALGAAALTHGSAPAAAQDADLIPEA